MIALYDGPHSHRCYNIMIENGVTVIDHIFSHKEYLEKTYPKIGQERKISYDKLAGTFMRFDVPFIEQEEEYVLYTDIDVIFMQDIKLNDIPKPKYLAAAPEFFKDTSKMECFNAGILVLNVKNMRERILKIFSDLKSGKPNKINLFDQGYLNQYCFHDMELLPLEYNWKPYWGINKEAKIIHYHGMKPGGNLQNSGFGMSDDALIMSLDNHLEDIEGYIHYITMFFNYINKDGIEWTSKFIKHIFLLFNSSSKDTYYKKKIKRIKQKYKRIIYVMLIVIVFFIGVIGYDF